MDCYEYIMQSQRDGMKMLRLQEDVVPVRHKRRQRDVNSKGIAIQDIQRTLGQDQTSRVTGESLEEMMLRVAAESEEAGESRG